jgi:hypothetical protein
MTETVAIPNEYGCCLSLRIFPDDAKCRQYRNSGSVSCRGCKSWKQGPELPMTFVTPAIPVIEMVPVKTVEEVIGMAPAVKVLCDEPGCKTVRWKAGKCFAHHPDNVAKRLQKTAQKGVKASAVKSVVNPSKKAALVHPPPVITSRDCSPFEKIGFDIGQLVTEKNAAYGNSFAVSGQFLRLLYPNGITPDQYEDALGLVRVFDKQKRIATDQDAFGESPWNDIAGYGILGVARKQGDL